MKLNYEEAKIRIEEMIIEVKKISDAVDNIKNMANNELVDIWQGRDQENYRTALLTKTDSVRNTVKWMDDVCLKLRTYITNLEESEKMAASKIQGGIM